MKSPLTLKIKFNVKEQSLQKFLQENLTQETKVVPITSSNVQRDHYHTSNQEGVSPYHLLQDEMYFKKDCGIEIGERLRIDLCDYSSHSRKPLTNVYIYKAEKYDDVSVIMKLEHFEIIPIKQ